MTTEYERGAQALSLAESQRPKGGHRTQPQACANFRIERDRTRGGSSVWLGQQHSRPVEVEGGGIKVLRPPIRPPLLPFGFRKVEEVEE
ncbi:MAG TPA: hypothetical protein VI636_08070 [Candidatus Angelobacter sp.]